MKYTSSLREIKHSRSGFLGLAFVLCIVLVAGIDSSKIKLYGLDRTKKSPDGLTTQFFIEKVPTFIFTKNGVEIGRVTEKPLASFEAGILTILAEASKK